MPVNDRHPSTPVDRLAPAIRSAVDTAGGPLKPIISSAQAGSHPVQADRLAPLIDQIVLKPEATAAEVVQAAHPAGVRVTLILKTSLLSEDQKMAGCLLAGVCRADFVRSSTGFGPSGATVEDVRPMRTVVGSKMGGKAAGRIRTAETALRMIVAGASRLGTSTGVAIVEQVRRRALAAPGAAGI